MGTTISSLIPSTAPPLSSVQDFDVQKYGGVWYQVAFLPNWFQNENSTDVKAIYTPHTHTSMEVYNESTVCGERRWIKGIAEKDPECCRGEGRFLVQFAPNPTQPVIGPIAPYWVIQLADDYRYAVVSEPTRRYLWILSRTPTMDERDIIEITQKLVMEQGFSREQINALVWTKHSDGQ